MSNIEFFDRQQRRQQVDRVGSEMTDADGGTGAPPPPDSWTGWRASVDARLEGLKGAIDSTRWVVGIVAVVMIGGFAFLGFQINRLEGRIDRIETAVAAIPIHLSEEFRAMRSEMAAQTSAIANSITATRQAQPPPPQIIVIPAPQPTEKPVRP
ncbi:MAG: hypothetical protein WA459_25030 [Stellaceae bacterium]